nr:SDR family NAD(P)-dependent oxidoreductase [Candidatus Rhodoblastus alkanivorans]
MWWSRHIRNIVITGASSGLGAALAREYAAPGVSLALIGRDLARLDRVAADSRQKGAKVWTAAIDVRDRAALGAFLLECDASAPLDGLILCAGVTSVTPSPGEVEDLDGAAELFDVNLGGAINAMAPIAPLMRRRRAGRIALFGSIAAFAPPPDCPSYAASKAALVAFGLATRTLYQADNVSVSVVCPGFVDTPMTSSYVSWKPFLVSSEKAARLIRRGLDRRKAIIAFPWPLYFAARLQQFLPQGVGARVLLRHRAFAAGGTGLKADPRTIDS